MVPSLFCVGPHSDLFTPVMADVIQFVGMIFLLSFFRRIGHASHTLNASAPTEPLLLAIDTPSHKQEVVVAGGAGGTVTSLDEAADSSAYTSLRSADGAAASAPYDSYRVAVASATAAAAAAASASATAHPNSAAAQAGRKPVMRAASNLNATTNASSASAAAPSPQRRSQPMHASASTAPNAAGAASTASPMTRHSYARAIGSGARSGGGGRREGEGTLFEHYSMRSDALLNLVTPEHASSMVPVPGTKDFAAHAAAQSGHTPSTASGVVVVAAPSTSQQSFVVGASKSSPLEVGTSL
jgi:hypothetical protein